MRYHIGLTIEETADQTWLARSSQDAHIACYDETPRQVLERIASRIATFIEADQGDTLTPEERDEIVDMERVITRDDGQTPGVPLPDRFTVTFRREDRGWTHDGIAEVPTGKAADAIGEMLAESADAILDALDGYDHAHGK